MDFRWANSQHSVILRVIDGAFIPVAADNGDYAALVASGAEVGAFQRWDTVDAAKAELTADVERRARALRVAVAGTDDATKLAAYREKYATAVAALAGDSAALAMLDPEASARRETPVALATLVVTLGDRWRAAGLAIDAAYQGHKAAIAALDDVAAAEAYDTSEGWP